MNKFNPDYGREKVLRNTKGIMVNARLNIKIKENYDVLPTTSNSCPFLERASQSIKDQSMDSDKATIIAKKTPRMWWLNNFSDYEDYF